ncbi:MAG: hypothetical protein ABIJ25_05535 [Pseudomonadota bacterium]
MGKINQDEMSVMLKEGKSQAECSRHFVVSEAAICKAVKRLKAAVIPASMEALTDKQKAFVLNLAEGKNATESAMQAYDCASRDVAKVLGCRMAKEQDITTALADIMAQEGIPLRGRIRHLKRLIESNDLSAVSRGLETSFKLDGSFAPEKIDVAGQIRVTTALIAEIKNRKREDEGLKYLTAPIDPDI